jgi:hypothetical protein
MSSNYSEDFNKQVQDMVDNINKSANEISESETCLEEYINWENKVLSIFNESQKVEYFKLINLMYATKYQYQQILSMKSENFLSKFFDEMTDWFSDSKRIAILQIEKEFYSCNIPLINMYNYVQHDKKLDKLENSDSTNKVVLNEQRNKSHIFKFYIKKCVVEMITNYDEKFRAPKSIYNFIS